MSRLATGGAIDRRTPLAFSFDGKGYSGFAGDTLASALVANDVKLIGRSFKYHRPRGILTAGSEEPNALVTLRHGAAAEPNSRATTISLFEGLSAVSQNRWPNLALDVLAVNQLFAPILVAGFYYKTFMWPASLWEKVYEPLIRRAAGLGALSGLPDPDHYDADHGFCDLLVIGGGPAGLAAALVAGRSGLRVIVADEDSQLGGRLLSERHVINDQPGGDWAAAIAAELHSLPNVTVLTRTTVFGLYDGREYGAVERLTDHLASALPGQPRQRLWKIVAPHTVMATGSIERPLVFGGNDRPGVMMASAVSTYVNRYAAVPGRRIAIFTTSDSGWKTAEDLIVAGIDVAAVIDPRPTLPAAASILARGGVECLAGAVVEKVRGRAVSGITVRLADGATRHLSVDVLAMAGGWNPSIGIASNLGTKPIWSDDIENFLVERAPVGLRAIGAAAGRFALSAALEDGVAAATAIVKDCGRTVPATPALSASAEGIGATPMWYVTGDRHKAFVDFQHDVTANDIDIAVREGFQSVEHLKRYTTLGMATDQGKTSQLNGHALLAAATGRTMAQTGTIMARPPQLPVAIGALAGHHRGDDFRPKRLTPSHEWAVERGAVFVDAGPWKRARWFPRPEDRDWQATVNREVTAVRNGVGLCDVSTLGKIDIKGPDAGVLLDRLYINTFSTLAIGKARYGLMLREDGIAFDDGTVTRFGPDNYYVTTTTANAGRVMQHIDHAREVLWPELNVRACSVSDQWATYAIAGPRSRALLQKLLPDLDLTDAAIPFMGVIEFRWQGQAARLFRVSFSGELAFEIAVPATCGDRLVRAIFDIGQDFGLIPYGTEALGVMRIEKGHVAGPELNGQTSASDLGLGRMASTKKDYIGRTLAQRAALIDPDRPVFVGLRCEDRRTARLRRASLAHRPGARRRERPGLGQFHRIFSDAWRMDRPWFREGRRCSPGGASASLGWPARASGRCEDLQPRLRR